MQIDRSRFLLLTASLAAAACDQAPRATSPDGGGAEPARSRHDPSAAEAKTDAQTNPSVWLEIEPGTEDRAPDRAGDCDNSVGRQVACDLSAPSSHCESFDSTQRLCESFASFMQPRAAEAAVDCMLAASGTPRICDWQIWNECAGAGLQASCVDPGTRGECDSISSACGGSIDAFTCQQALSAVRPQHMSQLASCVREFCEVPFCVTDLGQF